MTKKILLKFSCFNIAEGRNNIGLEDIVRNRNSTFSQMFHYNSLKICSHFPTDCVDFFRLNRKAKYKLEKDLADKFEALFLDKTNAELRNNSAGIRCNPACVKVDAK